ncbi:glycerol-3-phosphate 1-O-acyltransferase PlsB [Candidatus Palibaumannia cicadellinicola]|uniref:Glycerol-3-phosphate acyltransferase n=1 Tax=Candidatus Palibaumannia cicadellinicola TaxID=186490 RepID=A0A0K2BKC0_9GAMM|nr:glycerol-3-phosphate 1-O-acyltransferase PlsB [Candidatus Baumannia cicadellinicola]AKZ65647.1 Glycerol-3-phosphate acyltransferase [Candidatus Baumannia cicadellinicola]
MLNWRTIYYMVLSIPLKFLVKSQVIPKFFIKKIGLYLQQPIIYILPSNSTLDLLTMRIQCIKHGLPDPIEPINIYGIKLKRYIFIKNSQILSFRGTILQQNLALFQKYLHLSKKYTWLNVQIIPVLVMYGRSPGRDISKNQINNNMLLLQGIKKIISLLWLGRDSFVHFSNPLKIRDIYIHHSTDNTHTLAKKLARLVSINFARQKIVTMGPRLPVRKNLFKKLLASNNINKLVQDEAISKKISLKQSQQKAIALMDEIASNFSYEAIRISDRILGLTWNLMYQGLHVRHTNRIIQLAEKGHEMVYIPCHRSHMDYLLLSYVLYHIGLVPPHIAAGINLNFWPVGNIFRRLGAFFIHRTFKKNKLYSAIFREYLYELFSSGYSLEYFLEGSRSRTGRLLDPKKGTLTITIQSMLRASTRPITIVPIYIGYEHVIEVTTYIKELCGKEKKKDGLIHMFCGLRKLRNLGIGYVNFGEPIQLVNWLNQQVPQWRNNINKIATNITTSNPRPDWLTTTVDNIAITIMIKINNAVAVNAINLCAIVLLASYQYAYLLNSHQLISQLQCYLELLRNVPYAPEVTIPNITPEAILKHALALNKFSVVHNTMSDIIFLSNYQAAGITYYRNNIQHLFILPSLVAMMIINVPGVSRQQLHQHILCFYPMLKIELFMRFSTNELPSFIDNLIIELHRQRLLEEKHHKFYPIMDRINILELLAVSGQDTILRYAIILSLKYYNPQINRSILEKKSLLVANHIAHSINAPDLFDKSIFYSIINTLYNENYINDTYSNEMSTSKIKNIYYVVNTLIKQKIKIIITSSINIKQH